MAPTLRVIAGPAKGQSLTVDRELVIGRENADLTIEDGEMSRRHAAVRPVAGGLEIEDLGSLNGTFVDGRRVEDPVTMSLSGTVKVGTSEIAVELPRPQTTRPSDVPVAPADVTVARAVVREPPPDVTAPREVPAPEPDVTAPREVPAPEPDVTAPREVPVVPQPDVTAPREVPVTPAGEQTVQRGIPPAPPSPPAEAPPAPQDPGGPGPSPGKPGGRPMGLVLAGAAALLAIAAIIIFLLAAFGPGEKKRQVRINGQLQTVTQIQNKAISRGEMRGRPLPAGNRTTLDTVLGGPPDKILKGPTPFSGKATITSSKGSLTAVLIGTAEPGPGGRGVRSNGRAEFTGGSGDFKNARGSGRFSDDRTGDPRGRKGVLTVRGSFTSEG